MSAFEDFMSRRAASQDDEIAKLHYLVRDEAVRASKAEAEVRRLTALLEDRQGLAGQIFMAVYGWASPPNWEHVTRGRREHYLAVADRIRGYLKGQP